jgi:uncharacterized membrane protein YsdA (DUF1294 family)
MNKSVIVFTVVNALTFLVFAFITWEINPANWETETRTLLVWVGSLLGGLGAFIVGETK